MKSVFFANERKIIFGIVDKTREVVGFDKEDVFKKIDGLPMLYQTAEPAIILILLYRRLMARLLW